MPYFDADERLTRIFGTERQVWDAAETASLVEVAPTARRSLKFVPRSALAPPALRTPLTSSPISLS